jgi:O-antigen/teichoic acid export membrane protein
VNGVALLAFLAIASRRLSPADYSTLGVLWALLFGVGNGVMQPLEQEVARAVSARRARDIGPGPVIRRAIVLGVGFAVVVCALVLIGPLFLEYQSITGWVLVAFLVGLFAFCAGHLTRGILSSHHRFGAYGAFFATDGLSRVALASVLAAVGVSAVGAYGMLFALTPFIGIGVALARQRNLLEPGPEAPWSELTKALGWLLLGTASLSLVIQGGTIAVDWLATEDQREAAGVFLNGLQTARIPLFLFQAILASLLPKLSRLASTGAYDAFVAALRRLVLTLLGLGVVATVAAVTVGPVFVGTVFESETQLSARDLGLLAASFVVIMAAVCLDQALIALNAHSRMAIGWFLALVSFIVAIALGDDLYLRVEIGLLVGSGVAFAWMAVNLAERLRHRARAHELDLSEAIAEIPTQP